jgi:hypothetical protein
VATHVALVIVMLRPVGRSAKVVDVTLFALPISGDERPQEPARLQKLPVSLKTRRAAVARESATDQHVEPPRSEHDILNDTAAAPAREPAPPIDWHAEVETSVHALEERDRIESGRRSLAGPNYQALSASPQAPTCPFERCEPGWGANPGVFASPHSKAGRIEKIPGNSPITSAGSLDMTGDETILWINNWCYSVVVSGDRLRRGQTKCVAPLGKIPARGDLFDHMHEGQPAKSHDTEAPWISYGLSIGGSR